MQYAYKSEGKGIFVFLNLQKLQNLKSLKRGWESGHPLQAGPPRGAEEILRWLCVPVNVSP